MAGWLCFLLGFLSPFIPIAAVVLGYIGRKVYKCLGFDDHFDALVKTFWLSFILVIIRVLLSIVVIGYFILLGVTIYVVYESIRGLIALDAFSAES
jgi:uncharacterized membrane protein